MKKGRMITKQMMSFILAAVLFFSDCGIGLAAEIGTSYDVIGDEMTAESQMTEETAVEMTEDCETTADCEIEEGESQEEARILFELDERRKRSTKHFRLSDGTILAAQYGMDVHYETEDGGFAEIDNRFLYEAAEDASDFAGYSTADGEVEYKFAPQSGEGEILRLSEGEYSVGFELIIPQEEEENDQPEDAEAPKITEQPAVTLSPSFTEFNQAFAAEEQGGTPALQKASLVFLKGEVLNAENVLNSAEAAVEITAVPEIPVVWAEVENTAPEEGDAEFLEAMKAEKAVTSVGYGNVLPGVSLQYVVLGSSLKEYILVNEKQEMYTYDFSMNLENLIPVMQEEGSILLLDDDTEEAVYEIPAAFMTDAAGEYSDAVTMELTADDAAGIWILRITADKDWINAPERTFPVQIDPTISHTLDEDTCVKGSYVMELHPQSSRTQLDFISVGYSVEDGELRSYIQLKNLPTLPKDSVVCDARCYFGVASYSQESFLRMNVLAKEITGNNAWSTSYTWNNRPTVSEEVMDYQTLKRDSPGYFVGWNITELVKKHYLAGNTSTTISGFALEAQGADTMDGEDWANSLLCMDYDGAYPILKIAYRDSKGLEGYYTYQTHSVGNAGTVYVSDYSGKLTVENPLAAYNSTIQSYGLSLVYNSNYNQQYFTEDGTNIQTENFSNMKLGAGWKLSAQETVTEVSLPDETDSSKTVTWLIYGDSDGTEHYFKAKTDSNTEFEDEDGLNLTITKDAENAIYTMKDKKDNVKTFKNGYLTAIQDANGNVIHIVYNGLTADTNATTATGSNRITSVYVQPNGTNTANTIFHLVYDTSGFLTAIKEVYGKEYQFTYVTYGNMSYLKTISIYDGTTTTVCAKYGYEDANHHMTHVADAETDRGIYYIYEKSATGYRVSYFHEYAESQGAYIGRKVEVVSDELQRTVYRDYGADNSYGNEDDIFTTYLFNGYGHTININSTDNKDTILGVTA